MSLRLINAETKAKLFYHGKQLLCRKKKLH